MLDRQPWELPDEWWESVPAWLYDVQEHLKASRVGAFRIPKLTPRGWTYDLWELDGLRTRWRIDRGRIVNAGSIKRPRPIDASWYGLDDVGALELPERVRLERIGRIRLEEPPGWEYGRWGFAGRFGEGIVSGTFPDPTVAAECDAACIENEITDRIGFGGRLDEIAWIAPDGQVNGPRQLTAALDQTLGVTLVAVAADDWWSQVAGMRSWRSKTGEEPLKARQPVAPSV